MEEIKVKNVMKNQDVYLEGHGVVVEGIGGKMRHNLRTAREWFNNVQARRKNYQDEAAYQAELGRAQRAIDLLNKAR